MALRSSTWHFHIIVYRAEIVNLSKTPDPWGCWCLCSLSAGAPSMGFLALSLPHHRLDFPPHLLPIRPSARFRLTPGPRGVPRRCGAQEGALPGGALSMPSDLLNPDPAPSDGVLSDLAESLTQWEPPCPLTCRLPSLSSCLARNLTPCCFSVHVSSFCPLSGSSPSASLRRFPSLNHSFLHVLPLQQLLPALRTCPPACGHSCHVSPALLLAPALSSGAPAPVA